MESVFITAAVVALVELVKRIEARDWTAVVTIVGAGLIGGLAGYFHIDSLTVEAGVVAGLSAAGVYRLAQVVGPSA